MGRPNDWSEKKVKFLKENYSTMNWKDLVDGLQPFTKSQIQSKASHLNIKRENFKWNEKQIQFLKDNYGKLSTNKMSKELGRSESSILTKLQRMKISVSNKWTDEEIQILKDNYEHMSNPNINILLKGKRNRHSIADMAKKLGLSKGKYTYHDLDFILENLKKKAIQLGRTPFLHEIEKEAWCPSSRSMQRNFGGYRKICSMLNLDINYSLFDNPKIMLKSKNGDDCLSNSEVVITNFLIDYNIPYKREVYYKMFLETDRRFRCDWVINDNVVVEYFGMIEKEKYKKSVDTKLELLKKNNIKYIDLYPKDISNLKEKFREYIN